MQDPVLFSLAFLGDHCSISVLFQIQVYHPRPFFVVLKCFSIAVVAVLFRQSSRLQWDHFKALGEYREALDKWESALESPRDQPPAAPTRKSSLFDCFLFILLAKEKPDSGTFGATASKLENSARFWGRE